MLDHAVGIVVARHAADALIGFADMRVDMHARGVHPGEERFVGPDLALHEIDRRGGGFVVDRLHPLLGQRTGIVDLAVGRGPQHAARRAGFDESGVVLRVVWPFRLLLGVEVVEIAEELVEAVLGRQVFVAVAEVVLAELAGGVAERLQRLRDRHVAVLQSDRRTGDADLAEAGAQADLSGDEGRAPGRAAVLRVIVGEHHAFLGDAVDIRGLVADDAEPVGADIGLADVVPEDDEDVGPGRRGLLGFGRCGSEADDSRQGGRGQDVLESHETLPLRSAILRSG